MDRDLNLILMEYADARRSGSEPEIGELLARYPEHADAIRRFAYFAEVQSSNEPWIMDDPMSEARYEEIAVTVAQRMRPAASRRPLRSLVNAAKAVGLDRDALMRVLDLPLSFMQRLDHRLIVAESIPRRLVERLAVTLNRTVDEVADYLRMPPALALGSDHRATKAPAVTSQIDFRAAVAEALDLTPEQKARWLSEE